ncbi:MAG: PKD domain-containing protein [Candidatus Gracilibacteria bacterium]|jgi:PKD repeat protein|nr:PKD domain-containing protein [Candidatus Gracilibacteria bacterium]
MSKLHTNILKLFLIPLFLLSTTVIALDTAENQIIKAVINGEDKVKTGKTIELSAKDSFLGSENAITKYEWDFGDGSKGEGINIAHTYESPGIYQISLKIKNKSQSETIEKEIFVYNKQILLISDSKSLQGKLSFIEEYAKTENTFVNLIESFNSATDFISQEVLLKKFSLENEKITSSSDIIIWTGESAGINALNRHLQINPNHKEKFSEKNVIIIGDIKAMDKQRLSNYFKTISPKKLLVTKESAIYPILDNKEDIKESLIDNGIEFVEIEKDTGSVKIWNIMSYGVNKLIEKGIPESAIVLILLFPLIISFLIFLRQIIGIIFPNVLFPALITLAFLVIGLYAGIVIVLLSAFTIYTTKKLLKNTGMLYTTKTGIVLILLSFQMLFLLVINNFLELFNNDFFSIAIMPAMFLATITEQIIKTEIGLKKTIKSLMNLMVICTSIYLLLGGQISIFSYSFQFTGIKEFTQIHPEIVPILLVFNFLIGKWTGLRLLERIRFRNLLKTLD